MTSERRALVVDASALGAVAFNEPELPEVAAQLADARLFGTPVLPFELVNIARNKARRYPEHREHWGQALRYALALDITVVEVDYWRVYELAEAHLLTSYDASYLWLASELNVPLVTLDRELHVAYERRAP